MSRYDALQMAAAAELDLVEVSPTAEPPVVRIMDYGKFLFEQNKNAHSAKRKQKQIHSIDLNLLLLALRGVGFLVLLEQDLTVIDDAHHARPGCRRHLYQI